MAHAYQEEVNRFRYDTSKGIVNAILTNDKLTEEEKSELIARTIEEFKTEYPDLKYHATKNDVTETELRLTKEIEETRKEIEEVRKEIKEVEFKLSMEIEEVRKEIKEVELKLSMEIEEVRKEIEVVRKEIKEVELRLTKEIKELDVKLSKEIKETKAVMIKWSFLFWISQMGALLGIGFFIFKALSL